MKIGIGTAQFGLDYGISNQEGQTPPSEVKRILDFARKAGINLLDTASQYGTSETVLGVALGGVPGFKIVTKCPPLKSKNIGPTEIQFLEQAFLSSLQKLRQTALYGLLLHRASDLIRPGGTLVWDFLQAKKNAGQVKKVGISVYAAADIDKVLEEYPIDLVQLPINVFDQRLLHSGHLERLRSRGVEVHARSAFLQGLLLMDPAKVPVKLQAAAPILRKYQSDVSATGGTVLAASLQFVHSIPEIDAVICGVNHCEQLQEICESVSAPLLPLNYSQYALTDEDILDPSRWPKG